MKKSIFGKVMFMMVCALAGSLTGYGIVSLIGSDDVKAKDITQDSTLVRQVDDSVLFDTDADSGQTAEQEISKEQKTQLGQLEGNESFKTEEEAEIIADLTPNSDLISIADVTPNPDLIPGADVTPNPDLLPGADVTPNPTSVPKSSEATGGMPIPMPAENTTEAEDTARQVVDNAAGPVPTVSVSDSDIPNVLDEEEAAQVITYPAEIFGQTPTINRSDEFVTYFEFCLDLINMLEPEVDRQGLNETSLIAKFVFKALLCGIDVRKIGINDPIPREMAALTLWLAAQVMEEEGTDTKATQPGRYVTDIGSCSSSEKKAIAYLYEQGIVSGYMVEGQQFYPKQSLRTGDGTVWLERTMTCWK